MRAYKFVEPAHLKSTLQGIFSIRTLEYYRRLESEFGDEQEGVRTHQISRSILRGNDPRVGGMRTMFEIVPDAYEYYRNCTVEYVKNDMIVLCLSQKADNEILIQGGKTSIVVITDVGLLAHRITKKWYNYVGRPMIGAIEYTGQLVSGWTGFDEPVSAFRKDKRFAGEQEIRICWPILKAGFEGGLSPAIRGTGLIIAGNN